MNGDFHVLSVGDAAGHILAALEAGRRIAVVAVVADSDETVVGRRILVKEVGGRGRGEDVGGTLDDPELDRLTAALGTAALRGDEEAGGSVIRLETSAGRTVDVYLEVHHPTPELVIVGAGHIAQPLCSLGALLGFRVSVLDDRPDFATRERFPEALRILEVDFSDPFRDVGVHPWTFLVLVTRGHKYDYECLLRVLRSDPQPAYVGMIGSRRRVRATYSQLLGEDIPRDRIAGIRAPLGLDLGAQTPEEIAISVAAEIVLLRRGGSGAPLKDTERVLERFFNQRDDGENGE